ncbi:MAG: thiolase family protein [Candidatus Lokiarchaeota archaeon]|nr:thiolase family protein [Candidatus Lokiarchaeota archaeon]
MTKLHEVVVVAAKRAPMGKSGWKAGDKKGIHYWANPQDFTGQVFAGIWSELMTMAPDIKGEELEVSAFGCSGQYGGQSGDIGRIAAVVQENKEFYPVFGVTVDAYCNAGTSAIQYVNNMLALGQGEIGLAGGQELLSIYPLGSSMMAYTPDKKNNMKPTHKNQMEVHPLLMKRTLGLGPAGEKIAGMWNEKAGICKREDLDELAARSHRNMIKIQRNKEAYEPRIIPIIHPERDDEGKKMKDPETNKWKTVTCKVDETPRAIYLDKPDVAMEKMRTLKARFKADGVIHAGNSSAISDGGAAMILMTEEKAAQHKIKPLARVIAIGNAASEPSIVLTGPIPASKKAFARSGLGLDDMGLIHINEAFASVPFVTMYELGGDALTDERLNTSGGAIAGGHPIGASGVAWCSELLHEMTRLKKRYGMFTLCAGFGNGMTILFENMRL